MQKIQTKFEFRGFDPKLYWNRSPKLQKECNYQHVENQVCQIFM